MKSLYLILLPLIAISLAACSGTPRYSTNTYSVAEAGELKSIVACNVLAIRQIQIRDQEAVENSEALGTLAGGIGGALIGGQFGGDSSDRDIGAGVGGLLGALAGGIIGQQAGESSARRPALEYAVKTDDGSEFTVVQEVLQGEIPVGVGQKCRLQVTGTYKRVLPAL